MMIRTNSGHQSDSGVGISRSRSRSSGIFAKSSRNMREPYRATRLWLKAVAIFRQGVPLAKHRRQWKTYENCFVASEAVTWFQMELQQAFHSDSRNGQTKGISRQQTLQLLQKFYKAGIFVKVSNISNTSISMNSSAIIPNLGGPNETDFKDNGQLYRLSVEESEEYEIRANPRSYTKSEEKRPETNSKPAQGKVGNYSVIIKPLSLGEINKIWEDHFIQRLISIAGSDVVRLLYKQPNLVAGHWIAHNLTQIGKYGIVKSNKCDDLPKWMVQAMKCLANWPNHNTNDNDQPNYPGFENDVFKLIADYFNKYSNKGKGPLLTFGLYDAFVTSFIQAELLDFNTRLYAAKNSSVDKCNTPTSGNCRNSRYLGHWKLIASPHFHDEQYPFNASESVENLLLDILTPQSKATQQRKLELGKPKKIFPQTDMDSNFENSFDRSIPYAMPVKAYNISRYTSTSSNAFNPNCYYYETAFTNDLSPLTRVISRTELQTSFGPSLQLPLPSNISFNKSQLVGKSGVLEQTYAYENPTLDLSGSELIHHPKYSKLVNSTTGLLATNSSELSSESSSTSYSFCQYSYGNSYTAKVQEIGEQTKPEVANLLLNARSHLPNANAINSSLNVKRLYGMSRSYSATDLSDSYRDRSPFVASRRTFDKDELEDIPIGKRESARRTLDFYYGADACIPGLVTSEGKRLAVQAFRFLTLLLTPVNRRHLQLLLRCMAKMAKNDKLMLDVAMTTRAIVVDTFFKSILCCDDDTQFDELLALRIVTFMMDNDSEIFCLQSESDLVDSVQKMISEKQIIKVANEKGNTPKNKLGTSSPLGGRVLKEKQPRTPSLLSRLTPRSRSTIKDNNENVTPKSSKPETPNKRKEIEQKQENEENQIQFCGRITLDEYEEQKLLSVTAPALRQLLDVILQDTKMNRKQKKERLEKFVAEYPHIYTEKFGDSPLEEIFLKSCEESMDNSCEKSIEKSKQQTKKSNPFNRLFKSLRL